MRIKSVLSIAFFAVTLAGTAAFADPPPKKKPTYPPPEQSNTIGSLGQPQRDPNAPPPPRESAAPLAAPAVPKVDAEPPMPSTTPENYVVRPDIGAAPAGDNSTYSNPNYTGSLGSSTRPPAGPPPTGFLPDHPFVSGIVAGLVGADLGAKLYGGPMMGDQDGVMIGYGGRIAVILLLAWLVFRVIANKASGAGEPGLPPPGRREPSFDRSSEPRGPRREPTFGRRDP